jgi:transcriptional regulator with XRE-family HTH domain
MIGVYVCRDAAGLAVYIGSSGDIDKRIAAHSGRAPWWPEVASVERIEVETRALAFHRERDLIHELAPSRNRMSNTGPSAKAKGRDNGPVVRPRPEAMARLVEAYGTVAGLAAALGCAHMTLSDIWRGVHYPSGKIIARLIVVSGIPFDELFYVDPQDATPDEWLSRRERGAA